ncbi:MAG: hypothetical protein ACREFP_26620 [Acetobacteraceae bacterium]
MRRAVGCTPAGIDLPRLLRRLGISTLATRPVLTCLAILLLTLFAAPAVAETSAPIIPLPSGSGPIHVEVGLFVTDIYGFDLPNGTYGLQFWPWFLTTDPDYKPLKTVVIVNGDDVHVRYPSIVVSRNAPWANGKAKVFWDSALYTATLRQQWNVAHFPFDRQTLEVEIEDSTNDDSEVVFEPYPYGSGVDPSVTVPGWKIVSFTLSGGKHLYPTSFGNPVPTGSSIYSRTTAQIVVQRRGLRLFINLFNGFFVAFLLATLTYWMNVEDLTEARVGLCAGAIFAAVGSKYAVDISVPPSNQFTLADAIEVSSYATIVFALAAIVLLRELAKRSPAWVGPANLACGLASVAGYVSFNVAMILAAMR